MSHCLPLNINFSGLDELDRIFTTIFGCVIGLQIAFLLIGLFYRRKAYRMFLRFHVIAPIVGGYFALQHEMGFYAMGTAMLVLAALCVAVSFLKPAG